MQVPGNQETGAGTKSSPAALGAGCATCAWQHRAVLAVPVQISATLPVFHFALRPLVLRSGRKSPRGWAAPRLPAWRACEDQQRRGCFPSSNALDGADGQQHQCSQSRKESQLLPCMAFHRSRGSATLYASSCLLSASRASSRRSSPGGILCAQTVAAVFPATPHSYTGTFIIKKKKQRNPLPPRHFGEKQSEDELSKQAAEAGGRGACCLLLALLPCTPPLPAQGCPSLGSPRCRTARSTPVTCRQRNSQLPHHLGRRGEKKGDERQQGSLLDAAHRQPPGTLLLPCCSPSPDPPPAFSPPSPPLSQDFLALDVHEN